MTSIFTTWQMELNKMGFLRESHEGIPKKIYTLKPPLRLRFFEKVIEKITKYFHPKFEVGGILLAKPTLKNGVKILEVKKVIFLRNLSSTPERVPF